MKTEDVKNYKAIEKAIMHLYNTNKKSYCQRFWSMVRKDAGVLRNDYVHERLCYHISVTIAAYTFISKTNVVAMETN